MKTIIPNLVVIVILLTGCDKDQFDTDKNLTDGFCIVSNNEVVLNHNDFEYYDYSTHLIYLKDNKSFADDIESIGDFTVYAGGDEIYSGQTLPGYSSFLPSGPVIGTHPSFYNDNIVSIGFILYLDTLGNSLPDPREDERIIDVLKRYNQFHAGLGCEIKSVQYLSRANVKAELLLTNNDSFNYHYIDPEKTGIGLFHYFTNGLLLRNFNAKKTYTHKTDIVSADPWNTWSKDWLSVINGNESKVITLVYDNFEDVPKGQYSATFEFPGLSFQVDKKDIIQNNGQIWLGKLNVIKEIVIE
ncbi:hypothetical protein SAMN05444274_102113 [Mariniphaga anaerophila]|uniref:Uncharacterized protein n=1 Tax=Mariniphaga anaerophila TaxID=1484053 RepID=A0A1M4VIX0_9BACT|nr:hypothetical protein [Mariniphaga anaerophila]SHE68777.1 hypothetical protein SAMN05444274_102113 [Mariniphaga anaerophila]